MNRAACNGCGFLRFENWPHGALAARCGNPAPTGCGIVGYGRTLDVFPLGNAGTVIRPVWCGPERIPQSALPTAPFRQGGL